MSGKYIEALFAELSAPYPQSEVKWRIGKLAGDKKSGMALCYVDARTVMDRFDQVFGFEGWNNSFQYMENGTVVCTITVHIKDPDTEEVFHFSKSDGAGPTDYEAEKGQLSDAFKRASVMFGAGRYLYSVDGGWGAYTGKSWEPFSPQTLSQLNAKLPNHVPKGLSAKAEYTRLTKSYRNVRDIHRLKDWADQNADTIKDLPEDWRKTIKDEYKEWLKVNLQPEQQGAE